MTLPVADLMVFAPLAPDMMMLHASTRKLMLKLCELTQRGDIAWREGEESTSILDTEGYLIEVSTDPTRFRILNDTGREIEVVTASDLAGLAGPTDDIDLAGEVTLMAARASRVARGAELAITRILSSLSAPPSSDPEGEPLPAALEFEPLLKGEPHTAISAAESDAELACVAADMATNLETVRLDEPPVVTVTSQPALASENGPDQIVAANDDSVPQPPSPDTAAVEQSLQAAVIAPSPLKTRPAAAPAKPARAVRALTATAPMRPAPHRDMFGSIQSFARNGAQPASSTVSGTPITKITASGLLISNSGVKKPAPPAAAPQRHGPSSAEPYKPWR